MPYNIHHTKINLKFEMYIFIKYYVVFLLFMKKRYRESYEPTLEKIRRYETSKDITMNDVVKLDLSMDEYAWFMEYLKILKTLKESTEDKMRIKNMIYQKYIELKNADMKTLNTIKTNYKIDNNIIAKILSSNHTEYVKSILYKKYMGSINANEDVCKTGEWIDNVLNLPVNNILNNNDYVSKNKSIHNHLSTLWTSLNNDIYGLQNVKEKIMETMCAKLINNDNKGKTIMLVGPPGVGKTAMAESIAKSLNMPFEQISFGAINDSAVLTGYAPTYIGAVPGLFTKILMKSKRLDNVVLLDELDKISDNTDGRAISSVLLHVLDKTQNYRFKDMYMSEVAIDLSQIIFIASANNLENVNKILLDRMIIININEYNINDKIEIGMKFMFPRIRAELGFGENELKITKLKMKYLIEKYDNSNGNSGVRNIEKKLYQLCEKILLLKYAKNIDFSYCIPHMKFPLIVDNAIIDELMK